MTADDYKNMVDRNAMNIPAYGKVMLIEDVFNLIDTLCAGENDVLHSVIKSVCDDFMPKFGDNDHCIWCDHPKEKHKKQTVL